MEKEIMTKEGRTIYCVSKWLKIKTDYNVSKRHPLYYYAIDENGYREYDKGFNPENGLSVMYFVFHGRKYAIDQFFGLNNMYCCLSYTWKDKDGKFRYLSGYDSENYYNPLMIEMDCNGEYIKVYAEKQN